MGAADARGCSCAGLLLKRCESNNSMRIATLGLRPPSRSCSSLEPTVGKVLAPGGDRFVLRIVPSVLGSLLAELLGWRRVLLGRTV
jgi:hypothetical protein